MALASFCGNRVTSAAFEPISSICGPTTFFSVVLARDLVLAVPRPLPSVCSAQVACLDSQHVCVLDAVCWCPAWCTPVPVVTLAASTLLSHSLLINHSALITPSFQPVPAALESYNTPACTILTPPQPDHALGNMIKHDCNQLELNMPQQCQHMTVS
jgi:hypothetical protein